MRVLNCVFNIGERKKSGDDEVGAKSPQLNRLKAKFSTRMVGERSIRGEVRAEALVDCMEVRMPE